MLCEGKIERIPARVEVILGVISTHLNPPMDRHCSPAAYRGVVAQVVAARIRPASLDKGHLSWERFAAAQAEGAQGAVAAARNPVERMKCRVADMKALKAVESGIRTGWEARQVSGKNPAE